MNDRILRLADRASGKRTSSYIALSKILTKCYKGIKTIKKCSSDCEDNCGERKECFSFRQGRYRYWFYYNETVTRKGATLCRGEGKDSWQENSKFSTSQEYFLHLPSFIRRWESDYNKGII